MSLYLILLLLNSYYMFTSHFINFIITVYLPPTVFYFILYISFYSNILTLFLLAWFSFYTCCLSIVGGSQFHSQWLHQCFCCTYNNKKKQLELNNQSTQPLSALSHCAAQSLELNERSAVTTCQGSFIYKNSRKTSYTSLNVKVPKWMQKSLPWIHHEHFSS